MLNEFTKLYKINNLKLGDSVEHSLPIRHVPNFTSQELLQLTNRWHYHASGKTIEKFAFFVK